MSMTVDTLPINQAALALAFPEALLRHLVNAGVIAGDKSNCNLDEATQIAALIRSTQFPVSGKPIPISEAVKKYGFGTNSIYKWVAKGWVKIIEQEPIILVDEGDMVLAQNLSSLVGKLHGRAIFPAKPRSGRPKKAA